MKVISTEIYKFGKRRLVLTDLTPVYFEIMLRGRSLQKKEFESWVFSEIVSATVTKTGVNMLGFDIPWERNSLAGTQSWDGWWMGVGCINSFNTLLDTICFDSSIQAGNRLWRALGALTEMLMQSFGLGTNSLWIKRKGKDMLLGPKALPFSPQIPHVGMRIEEDPTLLFYRELQNFVQALVPDGQEADEPFIRDLEVGARNSYDPFFYEGAISVSNIVRYEFGVPKELYELTGPLSELLLGKLKVTFKEFRGDNKVDIFKVNHEGDELERFKPVALRSDSAVSNMLFSGGLAWHPETLDFVRKVGEDLHIAINKDYSAVADKELSDVQEVFAALEQRNALSEEEFDAVCESHRHKCMSIPTTTKISSREFIQTAPSVCFSQFSLRSTGTGARKPPRVRQNFVKLFPSETSLNLNTISGDSRWQKKLPRPVG